MKCSNCGKEIPDDAFFCQHCGSEQVPPSNTSLYDDIVETGTDEEKRSIEDSITEDVPIAPTSNQTDYKKTEKKPGLKWYYFIINFQIWLYMLGSFVNGFTNAVGPRFGDWNTTNAVYDKLPALKSVDVAFGFCMFALVVFAFITRRHLARFKPTGPKYYIVLGVSYPILTIIYSFVASIVSNIEVKYILTSNEITQIIVSIVFVAINIVYFRKRKSYFTSMLN